MNDNNNYNNDKCHKPSILRNQDGAHVHRIYWGGGDIF